MMKNIFMMFTMLVGLVFTTSCGVKIQQPPAEDASSAQSAPEPVVETDYDASVNEECLTLQSNDNLPQGLEKCNDYENLKNRSITTLKAQKVMTTYQCEEEKQYIVYVYEYLEYMGIHPVYSLSCEMFELQGTEQKLRAYYIKSNQCVAKVKALGCSEVPKEPPAPATTPPVQ